MKEAYLTTDDCRNKTNQWLQEIPSHPNRRKSFQFNISSAALLVLDMQEFFLNSDSHAFIPSARAILPNIERLTKFFRKMKRPVIFTRHCVETAEEQGIMKNWWQDIVIEGTSDSQITPLLSREGSDIVLRKTRYSAFMGTELEKILRERNVREIVISGVTTHLCCDTTARDAFMRDFEVYFVIDGTATWTEDFHISSLKLLTDGFAIPVTTDELFATTGGQISK